MKLTIGCRKKPIDLKRFAVIIIIIILSKLKIIFCKIISLKTDHDGICNEKKIAERKPKIRIRFNQYLLNTTLKQLLKVVKIFLKVIYCKFYDLLYINLFGKPNPLILIIMIVAKNTNYFFASNANLLTKENDIFAVKICIQLFQRERKRERANFYLHC